MIAGRLILAVLLLGASVGGFVPECAAQNGEALDGRIAETTCKSAYLMRGGNKLQVSYGMGLKGGDVVYCSGPGQVNVVLPKGNKVVDARNRRLPIDKISDNPEFPVIAEYLTGYGLAGATRGRPPDSRILWPEEGSVVVPEHFVARWAPVSQKVTLTIMSEAKDVTVWGPTEIDGASGSLKTTEISSALASYKAKSPNPNLVLTIAFANASDWEEVNFSLLKGREEEELNSQLDFWAKHSDGLALHLGRGYSFMRYKLYSEAAEEYESALTTAPESPYLLEDAIRAERMAGRDSRVKELETRLKSQPIPAK
jgi:hypothetical protein